MLLGLLPLLGGCTKYDIKPLTSSEKKDDFFHLHVKIATNNYTITTGISNKRFWSYADEVKLAAMYFIRYLADKKGTTLTEEDKNYFNKFLLAMNNYDRINIWNEEKKCLRTDNTHLESCCTEQPFFLLFAIFAYEMDLMPIERLKEIGRSSDLP